MIGNFIQGHMDLVFFVYGLSFFLLGAAVFFQVRKGSDFKVGKYLWLLGTFGLMHGVNEWLDLFVMVQPDSSSAAGVEVCRFLIGKVSYLFLLLFGVSLPSARKGWRAVPIAAAVLYSLMIAGFFIQGVQQGFSPAWFSFSDALFRYFLALPAALLAARLFFTERHNPEILRLNLPSISRGLYGLGVCFLAYAFFAGLVVKPAGFFPATFLNYDSFTEWTGLPVQFLRAGCASAMAFFLCRVLYVFEYETTHKLDQSYREIIRISNQEQMRIGQDLHDDLGQQLTGIAFMSRVLQKHQRSNDHKKAAEVLTLVTEELDRAIDTTRSLARGLCPISIETEGLEFALEELLANTEKIFRVLCSLEISPALNGYDRDENAIQLFRIAQEAISNAIKHGSAKNIELKLLRDGLTVTLSIFDDGLGLANEELEPDGLGLKIMRYRAGVLGGDLNVVPRPSGGTAVVCSFRECAG